MLQEKLGYLDEDSKYRRPIVYYVYHDRGFELFDRHLYNKGGWVLHMLRHQLGEQNFRRGINAYLERFRTKEVVTSDLLRTLEDVTGRSLERFFQQWVHGGGHPDLVVSYSWDGERKLAKVTVKQTQKIDELTACFYAPLDISFAVPVADAAVQTNQAVQTRTVEMRVQLGEDKQTEQTFYMPLDREPVLVRIDPEGKLLKTLKFERSAQLLRYQLAHDPDILGRIEAAEALDKSSDENNINALIAALNNDPFWGVRTAAAAALGSIGNEQAHAALVKALTELDAEKSSKVRNAVARALGQFQAPAQIELAQRSAQALRAVLANPDVSYLVEAGAAEALGKTRVEGNVDFLVNLLKRSSWTNYVQRGVFAGLGASGEDSVVDLLSGYALKHENHPTLRRAAVIGLGAVGKNRYLYSEEARQRAVTTLSQAVEHDSWGPVKSLAAQGLVSLGDASVAGLLERLADVELDSSVQRSFLTAARQLRSESTDGAQIKQLRQDLDEVRAENRKLREQMNELLARLK
jgi:aminopeptidase N